jgi:hypothetical protein
MGMIAFSNAIPIPFVDRVSSDEHKWVSYGER